MSDVIAKEMMTVMRDATKSTWNNTQSTGFPKYWEYINSSIFIPNNLANFCTVSTSLIIIHKSGQIFFQE